MWPEWLYKCSDSVRDVGLLLGKKGGVILYYQYTIFEIVIRRLR